MAAAPLLDLCYGEPSSKVTWLCDSSRNCLVTLCPARSLTAWFVVVLRRFRVSSAGLPVSCFSLGLFPLDGLSALCGAPQLDLFRLLHESLTEVREPLARRGAALRGLLCLAFLSVLRVHGTAAVERHGGPDDFAAGRCHVCRCWCKLQACWGLGAIVVFGKQHVLVPRSSRLPRWSYGLC